MSISTGISTKNHSLELPFTGSANVVFNGSFFYYNQEKDSIVKLDLATRDKRCLQIPTGRQRQRVGHAKVFVENLLIKMNIKFVTFWSGLVFASFTKCASLKSVRFIG